MWTATAVSSHYFLKEFGLGHFADRWFLDHRGTSTGTTGLTGTGGSTNYGPHDSNLANKMDPRVDSDRG